MNNYSFYSFMQNLEMISYLSKPRYTLSIAPGINLSQFSISIEWEDND